MRKEFNMKQTLFFLAITLGAFFVPLIALRCGREWLIALLPIYLIIANTFALSFVTVAGLLTSLTIPIYAATFLISDILTEHYSQHDAKRAVFVGFMGQLLFVVIVGVMLVAPIPDDILKGYRSTFSFLPRLMIASFIAYLISQLLDIYVYQRIMDATGKTRLLWLRNNAATITAQLIDTSLFVTLAFYGSEQFPTWKALVSLICAVWFMKIVVAVIDTPYMYLSYRVLGLRYKGREVAV
jgi:uncharacterized integral membrane protein (TIGR00697 family)